MAKKHGSGRVTPKGTRPPEKKTTQRPVELPPLAAVARDRGAGKVGKRSGPAFRPITHNRGNR